MSRRKLVLGIVVTGGMFVALLGGAVTAFSVGGKPLIYRTTVNNNDLEGVEGIGTPGRVVHLSYRQRNFKEGVPDGADPFRWCEWKNGGAPAWVASTQVDGHGVFRFTNLRAGGTTVMMFPPSAGEDVCRGGLYTELLVSECDGGGGCTAWEVPTVRWLNIRRLPGSVGATMGKISGAYQAAISVADGPNDGPEYSDVVDVDQNGFDMMAQGTPGQMIEWRCGSGGTAPCPSIAIHDASTATSADPEYPFVVGTMAGHRPGGSVFAAAAMARNQPLGFTVNVNVKVRGKLDLNIGCDRARFFDFSVPFNF